MSERTQKLREVVYSQNPGDPFVIFKVLLDEIDTQAARIKGLEEANKREEAAILRCAKEIDRLKGVHGA
jgi:hypothetical protein